MNEKIEVGDLVVCYVPEIDKIIIDTVCEAEDLGYWVGTMYVDAVFIFRKNTDSEIELLEKGFGL